MTDAADIIHEALRDYVGDGDGADTEVLEQYNAALSSKVLNDMADELESFASGTTRESPYSRAGRDIIRRIRERAQENS